MFLSLHPYSVAAFPGGRLRVSDAELRWCGQAGLGRAAVDIRSGGSTPGNYLRRSAVANSMSFGLRVAVRRCRLTPPSG